MTDVMEPARTPVAESAIKEPCLCFTLQHWCLWQSEKPSLGDRWPGGEVLPHTG
jgi:hypothetical protein